MKSGAELVIRRRKSGAKLPGSSSSGSSLGSCSADFCSADFCSAEFCSADFCSADFCSVEFFSADFWSGNVVEFWSGNVVEFWSGNVVEFWSGNAVEFWSGNVVEFWWSGKVVGCWWCCAKVVCWWRGEVLEGLLAWARSEELKEKLNKCQKTLFYQKPYNKKYFGKLHPLCPPRTRSLFEKSFFRNPIFWLEFGIRQTNHKKNLSAAKKYCRVGWSCLYF